MTRAASIPAPTDILCESCGYTLNGLPADARCPECGEPLEASDPALRAPPAWESDSRPRISSFLQATLQVIFTPTRFFRHLNVISSSERAATFARIQRGIASIFAGAAVWRQMSGIGLLDQVSYLQSLRLNLHFVWIIGLIIVTYVAFTAIERVAAKLTAWESAYRGLRLPLATVQRALDYHSAHALVVVLPIWLGIETFFRLYVANVFGPEALVTYLYVLSGGVIVGAIYLFYTYWIAMRNMMFANR